VHLLAPLRYAAMHPLSFGFLFRERTVEFASVSTNNQECCGR
jgi:hypothetical protein